MDTTHIVDTRAERLSIAIVDHGAGSSIDNIDISAEAPPETGNTATDTRPRVEVLLRKIFDEPQLRRTDETPVETKPDTRTAPLAVDKTDGSDEPAPPAKNDSVDGVSTALPGVSFEDLSRFKRQMYRKDI